MNQAKKLSIPLDRVERFQYVKRMFPQATGTNLSDAWRGGRQEAVKRLNSIDVALYNRNHDFINGAVSTLSPYFRYGNITLKEAADHLRERFGDESEKLVKALAHRDYWRRVWYQEGDHVLSNLEPSKVPIGNNPMPGYIEQMVTGLPCMDAIVKDLVHDGYVHDHARKWFAAYVVHWLKVDWREAADWFENNLLDGDEASNHLSWQWVASTFSTMPYFFNKDVLARFTGEKHCAKCTVSCPFDASMEMLEVKLFSEEVVEDTNKVPPAIKPMTQFSVHTAHAVFVHDEMLSAAHPLIKNSMPKVFVFDPKLHGQWPLKRIQFVADCLSELPNVEIWQGDTLKVLETRSVGELTTQNTPNPAIKQLLEPFKMTWQPEEQFTEVAVSEKRLKRFSRYWSTVGESLYGDALAAQAKET